MKKFIGYVILILVFIILVVSLIYTGFMKGIMAMFTGIGMGTIIYIGTELIKNKR